MWSRENGNIMSPIYISVSQLYLSIHPSLYLFDGEEQKLRQIKGSVGRSETCLWRFLKKPSTCVWSTRDKSAKWTLPRPIWQIVHSRNGPGAQVEARCWLIIHSLYISVPSRTQTTSSWLFAAFHTSFLSSPHRGAYRETYTGGDWLMSLLVDDSVMVSQSLHTPLHLPRSPPPSRASVLLGLTLAITRLISCSKTAYWAEQMKARWVCKCVCVCVCV